MHRIKENLVWPNDLENHFDFADALTRLIEDYNNDFPHQALKYMTPNQFNESLNKELVLS